MSIDAPAQQAANAAAAASITLAGLTLAQINEIVTIGAGCTAILTGLCASWWYLARIRRMKRGDDE